MVITTPIEQATLRIKRANIALTRHDETRMFAPFLTDGKWSVDETTPTAYTDGRNEVYGAQFVLGLPTDAQVRFLVMHEKGHKFLMHLIRRTPAMKANPKKANIAADYVVNALLMGIANRAPDLLEMIPCALYDSKYAGWSVLEVFNDLPDQDEGGNGGGGGKTLDEHDTTRADGMSEEQREGERQDVTEDLRQGVLMAGTGGAATAQDLDASAAKDVDWRTEMLEWLTQAARGRDDFSWRRFNRRRLTDGLYFPSTKSEVLDEVVVAIDTSGSTTGPILAAFAATLKDFCLQCQPRVVRVLWWDTQVHAEQVFEGDYTSIDKMLKPVGGGGTQVSCVSQFLNRNGHTPDAVIVFTDGYVETAVEWNVTAPTLWLVTEAHRWDPPAGRKVNVIL